MKKLLLFTIYPFLLLIQSGAQADASNDRIKSYFSPNITQEVVAYLVNDLGLYLEWGQPSVHSCKVKWPSPVLKNEIKKSSHSSNTITLAPEDDSVHCPPYETGCLIDLLNWCPDESGTVICNEEGCTCIVGC